MLSQISIALGSIAFVLAILLITSGGSDRVEEKTDPDANSAPFTRLQTIIIPDNLVFAGERVPTELNDVYERIDREFLINSYWHSNTLLGMKRSKKYFKRMAEILNTEGIPEDFKYLAVAESGLSNATSPAGARGFWQFMEGTAKEYGLEVSKYVDERFHLEKSTYAACAYIKDAYQKTGSWTLAAASYNRGMKGILRAMEDQSVTNYYDLLLNTETSRYVPRLVAIKYIYSHPEKYGFYLQPDDGYQALKTRAVIVNTTINDLVKFATNHGTNYKYLKLLNPWLLGDKLPNKKGRKYTILIPVD